MYAGNKPLVATVKQQAQPVNVAGLISNRMVDAVQGTTNEAFHKALKTLMGSMGSGHTFQTLCMCHSFAHFAYNGAPPALRFGASAAFLC